eukprot:g20575.t1
MTAALNPPVRIRGPGHILVTSSSTSKHKYEKPTGGRWAPTGLLARFMRPHHADNAYCLSSHVKRSPWMVLEVDALGYPPCGKSEAHLSSHTVACAPVSGRGQARQASRQKDMSMQKQQRLGRKRDHTLNADGRLKNNAHYMSPQVPQLTKIGIFRRFLYLLELRAEAREADVMTSMTAPMECSKNDYRKRMESKKKNFFFSLFVDGNRLKKIHQLLMMDRWRNNQNVKNGDVRSLTEYPKTQTNAVKRKKLFLFVVSCRAGRGKVLRISEKDRCSAGSR